MIKTYRDVFHYPAVGYISIVIIHSMNERKIGSGNSLSCTGISWKFLLIFNGGRKRVVSKGQNFV